MFCRYILKPAVKSSIFYLFGLFAFILFSGYGLDTVSNLAEGLNVTKGYNIITNSTYNQTLSTKDFDFAAAGDWGCNERAQRTISNMQNKSPSLVLGLGDYSYEKNGECWLKMMSPLINKTRIVIGEHDFDENNYSRLQNYVNRFNLSDPVLFSSPSSYVIKRAVELKTGELTTWGTNVDSQ